MTAEKRESIAERNARVCGELMAARFDPIECAICGTMGTPFPRGGIWCPNCSPKLAPKP